MPSSMWMSICLRPQTFCRRLSSPSSVLPENKRNKSTLIHCVLDTINVDPLVFCYRGQDIVVVFLHPMSQWHVYTSAHPLPNSSSALPTHCLHLPLNPIHDSTSLLSFNHSNCKANTHPPPPPCACTPQSNTPAAGASTFPRPESLIMCAFAKSRTPPTACVVVEPRVLVLENLCSGCDF